MLNIEGPRQENGEDAHGTDRSGGVVLVQITLIANLPFLMTAYPAQVLGRSRCDGLRRPQRVAWPTRSFFEDVAKGGYFAPVTG